MHSQRPRAPRLEIADQKNLFEYDPNNGPIGGALTPDISSCNSPPEFPTAGCSSGTQNSNPVYTIGDYIYSTCLDKVKDTKIYKAFHKVTGEECLCKVLPISLYEGQLSPYLRVTDCEHVNQFIEIIVGRTEVYFLFPKHYGDLHSYVRNKKRLRETEASNLFRQILLVVEECHNNGVILRDLKLRKFVFKDPECTQLMLMDLDDVILLNGDDDAMTDKHGCPAYVSPEILTFKQSYSGKMADMWSIGVILYTMVIGRYPFNDKDPTGLFKKICRGEFTVPAFVSSRCKCLLMNLLRKEPSERLRAEEALNHPWFSSWSKLNGSLKINTSNNSSDQIVPEYVESETDGFFL